VALDASFLDELRARTPLQAVVARRVKLARSGRNMKGCCPFHGEKTASFYVYDDHFHCFGCGAHGDAVSFVMQSQGATFPEAVAQLAAEAGLDVPRATPEAAEAERRRHDLHAVAGLVADAFKRRLHAPEGSAARGYLERRGVRPDTADAWGLGWSGDGRGGLLAEMRDQGVEVDRLIAIGIVREDEDGKPAGELFYNRLIFPIRDARARTISFGGRTLGDGQPKYLNGPETLLFAKRRVLFGIDRARDGVRGGADLIVAEGYLDVIALHQAGFTGAVAPLGTALTDGQLEMLWQTSPCPVLCFDADAAGGRAASRATELALPLLSPERTLAIARLPAGEDPDSLLRTRGPAALRAVLDAARARPLSTVLFDGLRDGTAPTPEARAALRARLLDVAQRVGDPSLAREYRAAFLGRLWEEGRRGSGGKPAGKKAVAPARVTPTPAGGDDARARLLLTLLLDHPQILHAEEETIGDLIMPSLLRPLHAAMLDWLSGAPDLEPAHLRDHLARLGHGENIDIVRNSIADHMPRGAGAEATRVEALTAFWHFVGLSRADRLESEISSAREALAVDFSDANHSRLVALKHAQAQLTEMIGDPGDLIDAN